MISWWPMSRRRWLLVGLITGLLCAVAYLVMVRPRLWLARAEAWMAEDPCPGGQGPPGDGFYRAVSLAHQASQYPGLDRDRTDAAQSRCVATFLVECDRLRSEAHRRSIHSTTDRSAWHDQKEDIWRRFVDPMEQNRFCAQWDRYMKFLDHADADWRRTCAYCVQPPGPDVSNRETSQPRR